MTYSEYLKEKFISLYLKNEKIGKHQIILSDFDFISKALSEVEHPIMPQVKNIEQLFSYIDFDFNNDLILKNKIGFDFFEQLKIERKASSFFLRREPLIKPQITSEQKQVLEQKYINVADTFGLKEFYYTLNPNLTPEKNYHKAILLLDKVQLELKNLQQELDIKEPYKIGNGILSIQVNWQENPNNQGYYNHCSNTICLKDENSTFPLIHEYIHFIEKTTMCLLITGKTSQQLYEEKLFSQKELFENFDLSIFSKIEFKKENFPWIDILRLKSLFKNEINQNNYIQKIFNSFDSNKDYKQEFKEIIFNWIDEKKHINKRLLKQDINSLLSNNKTNFNFENKPYSIDEKELITKTLVFNTFDLTMNNSKNWSEELDVRINKLYYSTQKEMLARTFERSIQGNLEQLSDRLTTPKLSISEKNKFFEIIKSWQNISQEILKYNNKKIVSNRITDIRNKLNQKPDIVSYFKIN